MVIKMRWSNDDIDTYLPKFIYYVCEGALEDDELEVLVGHVPDVGVDVQSLHRDLAAVAGEHLSEPELLLQTPDKHLGRVLVRVEDDAVVTNNHGQSKQQILSECVTL